MDGDTQPANVRERDYETPGGSPAAETSPALAFLLLLLLGARFLEPLGVC